MKKTFVTIVRTIQTPQPAVLLRQIAHVTLDSLKVLQSTVVKVVNLVHTRQSKETRIAISVQPASIMISLKKQVPVIVTYVAKTATALKMEVRHVKVATPTVPRSPAPPTRPTTTTAPTACATPATPPRPRGRPANSAQPASTSLKTATRPVICVPLACRGTPGATSSTDCVQCETSKYNDQTGRSQCTACPVQAYAPAGSTALTNCTCNAGYTGPDGEPCSACEHGTYKPVRGPGACESCPTNANTTNVASTADSDCLCDAGYHGTITDATSDTCTACDFGEYKLVSGTDPCAACPDHATTLQEASVHSTDCRCRPGYTGQTARHARRV